MQKRSYQQLPCRYRPYDFPSAFPVLAFLGDYWQIDSAAPQYLHFHNGLEIGRCLGQDTLLYGNPEILCSFGRETTALSFQIRCT